jgi:hypothetical protein
MPDVCSLAEELLASAQKTEQAAEVLRDMEGVRKELEKLRVRWVCQWCLCVSQWQ